ncbi:LD-carboxypeptidase [Elizabethkingia anophelis]|uniref:S66 family peptidase n=1 Tax=Elizabethkingia anophelis TaxID=1117645 RepID=UPI000B3552E2|nr:S66 peptidase family protein [Elizabethkingia anophelis]MCT3648511.1 LD-carboxypeptidase [Elizabethkingia anophelis]MCT3695536.1 LD-carboxypeptidase [Elizabethkingia anophelis]MCT3859500.1 LD-carboxypeptidase [Elizabethkingia anophelis]MCT3897057.1 LD-carboxypeptidase [Elizabethkingia anophelis]MCT3912805.1 LD-carboxypeptidase [Elizabethkingia anophelis]
MILTRPQLLKPGDTVATLSLSWGGAGTFPHRYEAGKKQLEEVFGLHVIETKNALKSADYIYKNPQARAEDLMEAFSDSSVKAIISNIGGDDSIRTLPFTDLSVIRSNPKIFLGFSDTTVTHIACYKAGLTSFYGTSVLVGFAENGGMHRYQIEDIKRTLFSAEPAGQILPNSDGWTTERLEWGKPELQNTKRSLVKDSQWNFLQGTGKIKGQLIGGCVDVLEFLKGTDFWFSESDWDGKILFLETSEEMMSPLQFCWALRNYAAQGVFNKINGLILGRPYDNKYVQEYNEILLQVIRDEEGRDDLTIVTEMNFGHTCPVFTIPYGVMAEIDNERKTFSILESGVTL